jgi:HK97 family phage portal protein
VGILQRILGLTTEPSPDTETRSSSPWVTTYPSTLLSAVPDSWGAYVRSQPDVALAQATVWACVRMVSAAAGSMPWNAIHRSTRVLAPTPPPILRQPDPFQPREVTIKQVATSMLLRGEAFLWLTAHDRSGRATVAIPIPNDEVQVSWDSQRLRPVYQWRRQAMVLDETIMHLKYQDLGPGHLHGIGPVQAIAGTIGGNLNADRLVAAQFTEGAWVDGVLEAPARLTVTEAKRLREQWDEAHAGRRGTAVLEGGITYKPVQMSNQDAQLLESRTFYATDTARAFGVPAPLLGLPMGEGSSLTYQNLADIKSQFAQFAVQPVTDSIEAGFSTQLPSTQEALFSFAALLRSDVKTRYEVYTAALDAGILTLNEVRALEGLPAVPGGDVSRIPATEVTV